MRLHHLRLCLRCPVARLYTCSSAPSLLRAVFSLVSTLLSKPLVSTLVVSTIVGAVELHRTAETRAGGVVSSLSDIKRRLKLMGRVNAEKLQMRRG